MADAFPSRRLRLAQKLGLTNARNLFWACRAENNFGDWLAPYIFAKLSRRRPLYCEPRQLWRGQTYFTVGSMFHHITRDDVATVWGSGIIDAGSVFRRPRAIHAVRGPLTRQRCRKLRIDCPPAYGDPAVLMPRLLKPNPGHVSDIGLVPHFVDFALCTRLFQDYPDVRIIDVCRDPETVIADICACHHIASSSLHGLIIAHAYGLPAVRMTMSSNMRGDGTKFADYALSLGRDFRVTTLPCRSERDVATVLRRTQAETAIPDIERLQDTLLDTCPFLES